MQVKSKTLKLREPYNPAGLNIDSVDPFQQTDASIQDLLGGKAYS